MADVITEQRRHLHIPEAEELPGSGPFEPDSWADPQEIDTFDAFVHRFWRGELSALFDPAVQASLPTVVRGRSALHAMNSLLDATRRLARIVGPGLAGGLIAVLPMPQFFTVDALTFGVSAAALVALRAHFPSAPRAAEAPASRFQPVVRDLMEAGRLTLAHRPFLWSVMGSLVMNLTWNAIFTVGLALFVPAALEGSVGAYGAQVAVYGVANVLSALAVSMLRIRRRAFVYFLGTLVLGAGFLSLAGTSSVPLALVSVGCAALGGRWATCPSSSPSRATSPRSTWARSIVCGWSSLALAHRSVCCWRRPCSGSGAPGRASRCLRSRCSRWGPSASCGGAGARSGYRRRRLPIAPGSECEGVSDR